MYFSSTAVTLECMEIYTNTRPIWTKFLKHNWIELDEMTRQTYL